MSTMEPPPPPPEAATGVAGTGAAGTVRNIGPCILLAIVTLGIYTYFWVWWTQRETKAWQGTGVGGPLGFVIYFLVSPVTWFLVPAEIQQMYQRKGLQSPVSPWWGLWFLLPIIGNFVWFIRVQGALNEFWEKHA